MNASSAKLSNLGTLIKKGTLGGRNYLYNTNMSLDSILYCLREEINETNQW